MRSGARVVAVVALLAAPLLAAPTSAPAVAPPIAPASATLPAVADVDGRSRPAVVERRVIGRSVRGRPIRAWRVGRPGNQQRAVLLSTMHGDERQTRQILEALRDGPEIRGIDLWLVPGYNPDGYARGTRKNARGVDLNRNFPRLWAPLDGRYESGPRPASEPETRAVMRFLRDVRPHRVISFHQPLYGVDTDTKRPRLARKLSEHLNLPRKEFSCGGTCHGTMTMWFNHNFAGAAITVEYGHHPPRERMRVHAPRQMLTVLGARRVP